MNRKQRRVAEKRGTAANDLRQEQFAGIQFAVKYDSVAVATLLHNKLGFDPVRPNQTMAQIQDTRDSIQQGCIKICDLEKTLLEEHGIHFKDGEI